MDATEWLPLAAPSCKNLWRKDKAQTDLIAVGRYLPLVYACEVSAPQLCRSRSVIDEEHEGHQLVHVVRPVVAAERHALVKQTHRKKGAHFFAAAACLAVGAVCSQSMYLLHHATNPPSISLVQSVLPRARRISIPDAILASIRVSLHPKYKPMRRHLRRCSRRTYRMPVYPPIYIHVD